MSNDKHTPTSESFGSFVQRHLDSDHSETIATLRAEKAELIEALKQIEVYKDGDTWLQDIIAIKKFASQTLAKLKTK